MLNALLRSRVAPRYTTLLGWPIVRWVCQGGAAVLAVYVTWKVLAAIDARRLVRKQSPLGIKYYVGFVVAAIIAGLIVGKLIWDRYGAMIESLLVALLPFTAAFDSTTPISELSDSSTWV